MVPFDASLAILRHTPSIPTIITAIIGLLIIWIIVSIPVYIAAKLVAGGRAHFGSAMLATLVGPIIFAIVLSIGYYLTSRIIPAFSFLALFVAFLAWIWVYRAAFGTGWFHAFGVAILAVVIATIILVLLSFLGLEFVAFRHVLSLSLPL